MKLTSLNVWGGKRYKPLLSFIKKHSKDTDIFCFQEVFNTNSRLTESFGFRINLYEEITKALGGYQGYYAVTLDNYLMGSHQNNFTNYNLSAGLAIFVKKELKIKSVGDLFIYRKKNDFDLGDSNTIPRNLQYLSFIENNKEYLICNFHGIWLKEGKEDSPSRLKQSKRINDFLDKQKGEKIVCGDFNLDINTESIKILEKNLRNLIKDYLIQSTRNKYFPGSEQFADYAFVSPDVNITSFQVPNVEVSDHLPIILEFS